MTAGHTTGGGKQRQDGVLEIYSIRIACTEVKGSGIWIRSLDLDPGNLIFGAGKNCKSSEGCNEYGGALACYRFHVLYFYSGKRAPGMDCFRLYSLICLF